MKRMLMVLGLAVIVGACSSTTAPTNSQNTAIFTVNMLASNEVPPTAGAEASARGTATITFNLTRDGSGNLTAASAVFDVTMSGFPSTSVINIAHIHPGAVGVNGGVLVNTTLAPGDVTLNSNGIATFTKSNINVTVANAQAIMADPGGFYFNVHTAANPTGAIRGQLSRTQ
jgi:PBP1b-binding outer membrane lipoprotein LpoB